MINIKLLHVVTKYIFNVEIISSYVRNGCGVKLIFLMLRKETDYVSCSCVQLL